MQSLFEDLHRSGVLLLAVVRWGIPPLVRRLAGQSPSTREWGVRLRRLLEEQGLIYRKLGQYLAMRVDLLPREICSELDQLFDEAAAMPFESVRAVVQEELGGPLERFFASFEHQPIGSASVSQVHRAVAHDGEILAVKVQRLGIGERFQAEVRNVRRLAWLGDRLRLLGRLSILETFDEFAEFTARELDFVAEGQTADKVGSDTTPHSKVPRIRWDLTTERVLSMEFIDGVSLLTVCRLADSGRDDEIEGLLPGVDLDDVVDRLAEACFYQFFVTGLFHGDPHPANILVCADGRIVFIDFGIFGELSPGQRADLEKYIAAIARGRAREGARYFARLYRETPWTDPEAMERELTSVLAKWSATAEDPLSTIADRHMGRWQGELVQVLRRHHMRFRRDQLLVWRAMILLDTTGLRLPARFDVMESTRKFFEQRQLTGLARRLGSKRFGIEVLPTSTGRRFETRPDEASVIVRRQISARSVRRTQSMATWIAAALASTSVAIVAAPSERLILLPAVMLSLLAARTVAVALRPPR